MRRGITIVELLLVIVILTLIGFISYKELSNFTMEYRLESALDQLHGDILQVKTNSITKANPWGIRLEAGRNCYVIFEDRNRDCKLGDGSSGNENCLYNNVQVYPNCHNPAIDCITIVKLPKGIQSNENVSVVFDKKGYPKNAICGLGMNTNSISLVNSMGKQRKLRISRYGRIRSE